jgi:CRP-like cAMP-binding protein
MQEPLFAFIRAHSSMSEAMQATVAAHFKPAELAAGEHLLKAEAVCDRYLVVASGWLRSYTHDAQGDEVTTGFSGPGSAVFDVDSFFMRTPSRENIVALTRVNGAEIDFAGLNGLFHAHPEFREMGRAVLVKGFVALKQRMLAQIDRTAEERYAHLLRTRPELFQVAPLKHIASFLGVTDTSLSRIRREQVR